MAYVTVQDVIDRAGDRFLGDVDKKAAKELIEDAEAILWQKFERAGRDAECVNDRILKSVVCSMVLRAMDSFKRGGENAYDTYNPDPFASTSYFNYRGSMEPTDKELASLGLPKRPTKIGTFDIKCL